MSGGTHCGRSPCYRARTEVPCPALSQNMKSSSWCHEMPLLGVFILHEDLEECKDKLVIPQVGAHETLENKDKLETLENKDKLVLIFQVGAHEMALFGVFV